jgi:hypothetical protein
MIKPKTSSIPGGSSTKQPLACHYERFVRSMVVHGEIDFGIVGCYIVLGLWVWRGRFMKMVVVATNVVAIWREKIMYGEGNMNNGT